jgi:hypothetical protein
MPGHVTSLRSAPLGRQRARVASGRPLPHACVRRLAAAPHLLQPHPRPAPHSRPSLQASPVQAQAPGRSIAMCARLQGRLGCVGLLGPSRGKGTGAGGWDEGVGRAARWEHDRQGGEGCTAETGCTPGEQRVGASVSATAPWADCWHAGCCPAGKVALARAAVQCSTHVPYCTAASRSYSTCGTADPHGAPAGGRTPSASTGN